MSYKQRQPGSGVVFDVRRSAVENDGNDVERYLQVLSEPVEETQGGGRDSFLLGGADVLFGIGGNRRRPAFYLCKMQAIGGLRNDVDFQMTAPPVAGENGVSVLLEPGAGQVFPELSQRRFSFFPSHIIRV